MSNIQEQINRRVYSDNIPRPKKDKNFYLQDSNVHYLMKKYLPNHMQGWAHNELTKFGERVAGPIDERAAYTDREGRPVLKKYNRLGEDISEIWNNEGYKQTVREVYGAGIVGYLYRSIPEIGEPAPYLYSYLMGYILSQSEAGFYCPVTLTMSAAYLVDNYGDDEIKKKYLPGLTAIGDEEIYEGATWLTERQGGSDVGANKTVAVYDHQHQVYKLTGEKFFASNAGAMVATVLAKVNNLPGTKGLGLFLVPWIKPNGEKNSTYIRRLKDKLGVIAVPSAEVLLEEAEGYLIGEAGKGFKYMAEALNISRICNAIASIGILRRAFYEATHYTEQREAFGQTINQYSMVQQMLVDMVMELEITTGAIFDMIYLYDKVVTKKDATEEGKKFVRLLIPLLKYRAGEIAVEGCHTSIELHGGNGFIEEYVTPRLLRDAQVTTVWEGTANILALDLLRVLRKEEAHSSFLRMMEQRINDLSHPKALELVPELRNSLDEILQIIQYIFTLPYEKITYKLKGLANYMIDTLLLVQILSEAEEQYRDNNNIRKFILAKLFFKKHFIFIKGSYRGLLEDELLDTQYFKELIYVKPIYES